MKVLKDLAQQLKKRGIASVAEIDQEGPTAITAAYLAQVSGGGGEQNTELLDCHYNFNLTNGDGSGTFAQSNSCG